MMRRAGIILICAALCAGVSAQKLTRRTAARQAAVPREAVTGADTVRGAALDSVVVAGFDKPLRSTRESMFVTNGTASAISGLGIEITYRDGRGRMLHRASHAISADIPAGQTRRIEVPSFDRGGAFRYRLSEPPRGARQATPFDVTVKVTYIIP